MKEARTDVTVPTLALDAFVFVFECRVRQKEFRYVGVWFVAWIEGLLRYYLDYDKVANMADAG